MSILFLLPNPVATKISDSVSYTSTTAKDNKDRKLHSNEIQSIATKLGLNSQEVKSQLDANGDGEVNESETTLASNSLKASAQLEASTRENIAKNDDLEERGQKLNVFA